MKTVSNRIALHCLNHWQARGRDPAALLHPCGIAHEELLIPRAARHRRHFRLLAGAAPTWIWPSTGRPRAPGLFADFMSLASLCCNAATLRQALHFFPAYRPLIGESDEIRLQEEEGQARISYHSESDHPDVIAPEQPGQPLPPLCPAPSSTTRARAAGAAHPGTPQAVA